MPPPPFFDYKPFNYDKPLYNLDEVLKINPQRHEMEQLSGVVWVDRQNHGIIGFKEITDELEDDTPDLAVIRTEAATIAGFAPKVATWFPKGSGPDDGIRTHAKQTIWTKPEQFQQAAQRFVDESARFQALAQAGDIAAIRQGAKDLGAACKNCHDTFRHKD